MYFGQDHGKSLKGGLYADKRWRIVKRINLPSGEGIVGLGAAFASNGGGTGVSNGIGRDLWACHSSFNLQYVLLGNLQVK